MSSVVSLSVSMKKSFVPPFAKGSCEKIVSLFGLITRIKFLRVTIFSF